MKKIPYSSILIKFLFVFSFCNLSFKEIKEKYINGKQNQNHKAFLKNFEDTTITTERLYLSLTKVEDLDFLAPHILDEEAIRGYDSYSIWPKTIEEGKEYLSRQLSEAQKCYFTIRLKSTNEPIGQIGFSFFIKETLWICYWLSPNYQQKGYMSEIALPLIKLIFESCSDLNILHLRILKTNTPSIKLARKICEFVNRSQKYKYQETQDTMSIMPEGEKEFKQYSIIHFKLFKNKL